MKKSAIFVSLNTIIRGGRQTLASSQAGVFRFYERTATCTSRGPLVMSVPTRSERIVFSSGKGKSLFVCPKNAKHNVSQRNLDPARAGVPEVEGLPSKGRTSCCIARKNREITTAGSRVARQDKGATGLIFKTFLVSFSPAARRG